MTREHNAQIAIKIAESMAQRAGCSHDDAEEVAAQVLEKCCQSEQDSRFDWDHPHWGYLKGILWRTLIMHRRREKRYRSMSRFGGTGSDTCMGLDPVDERQPAPDQRLVNFENSKLLHQALQGLNERDRSLLHEHYWRGRRLIDVAGDNGEAASAIRNRKARINSRLRRTLKKAVRL